MSMRHVACLAFLVAALVLVRCAPEEEEEEVAIMHALRRSLHDANSTLSRGTGWQLANTMHPCDWDNVACTRERQIFRIFVYDPPQAVSYQATSTSTCTVLCTLRLPPELARLHWLQYLRFALCASLPGGFPSAWVAPGAFPRLEHLSLDVTRLEGQPALPPIQPGALPALLTLFISAASPPLRLPDSWGAPGVLQQLQVLHLQLSGISQLPGPAWAGGFSKLERLVVSADFTGPLRQCRRMGNQAMPENEHAPLRLSSTEGCPEPAADAGSVAKGAGNGPGAAGGVRRGNAGLPPSWSHGFPSLLSLQLSCLRLGGPLPETWDEGFLALQRLNLVGNCLSGTLPPHLLQRHPSLIALELSHNRFTGSLPEAWGSSRSPLRVLDLGFNSFIGTAFPPAWLLPAALPDLQSLCLSGNPALAGALPDSLPWRKVQSIDVGGSAVEGRVPAGWCAVASLSHLGLDQTAVEPGLPPCAEHALPQLWGAQAAVSSSTLRSGRLSVAAAAGLALALPALAAASTGVWRLWRRKQRVRQAHGHEGSRAEQGISLGTQPASASSQPKGNPKGVTAGSRKSQRRCEELEALLSSELGPGRGRSIVVRHTGVLPPHPEHSMHSMQLQRAKGASSARSGSSARRSSLLGWPSQGLPEHAALLPPGMASACHNWQLDTKSLQLPASDLVFKCDEHGRVVVLGQGAHAVVCEAVLQGRRVAVKVFDQPLANSQDAWREITLLERATHKRVVPLLGVAVEGQLMMLVMRLMRGGSLRAALQDPQQRQALRWAAGGRQVALDVAEGLEHLHSTLRIMHSDLKSNNVLLTEGLRACLADLGIAKVVRSCTGSAAAGFSCSHAAPEQVMGEPCTVAADMYSFGMLLIELTTQTLVDRRGEWRLPHTPHECPHAVLALIQACLQQSPGERPTAGEALQRLLLPEADG